MCLIYMHDLQFVTHTVAIRTLTIGLGLKLYKEDFMRQIKFD